MRTYWSDTRLNGKPLEPGTLCYVIDAEDGTNPIAVYGTSMEEVLAKVAKQNVNAQGALASRKPPVSAPAAQPVTPAKARVITPDDVMKATADLANPAKAGEAITTLLESATGIDPRKLALDTFARMAEQWEAETPEFHAHPGNKRLLTQEAVRLAGGKLAAVTKEHLTQALQLLAGQGILMEVPADDQPPTPSSTFPDESQVQRVERPRGSRFATGARSTNFQTRTGTTRTLKYTEEQIRAMPLSKSRQLIESNDPDYAAACDHYFGSSARSA